MRPETCGTLIDLLNRRPTSASGARDAKRPWLRPRAEAVLAALLLLLAACEPVRSLRVVLGAGPVTSTGAPFSDEERETDDDAEDFWVNAEKRRAWVEPPGGHPPVHTLHPDRHLTSGLPLRVSPPTATGLSLRLRC